MNGPTQATKDSAGMLGAAGDAAAYPHHAIHGRPRLPFPPRAQHAGPASLLHLPLGRLQGADNAGRSGGSGELSSSPAPHFL